MRAILISFFGVVPAAALCFFVLPLLVHYLGAIGGEESRDSVLGVVMCIGALAGTIALVFSVKNPPNLITSLGLASGIAADLASQFWEFSAGLWQTYFFVSPIVVAIFLIIEGMVAPAADEPSDLEW